MALVADRANRSRICRVKVAVKGEIALLLCESLIHVVVEQGVFSGETVLEALEGIAELAREQAGPESSEQKRSAFQIRRTSSLEPTDEPLRNAAHRELLCRSAARNGEGDNTQLIFLSAAQTASSNSINGYGQQNAIATTFDESLHELL